MVKAGMGISSKRVSGGLEVLMMPERGKQIKLGCMRWFDISSL